MSSKLKNLTNDLDPTEDDLVYLLNDPGAVPGDRKSTLKNVFRVVTRRQWSKGVDVASADEVILGTDGNVFDITGTTTINHIRKLDWKAGSVIVLRFDGVLTVIHNSASPVGNEASILLGDASNFVSVAGDKLILFFNGTEWEEIARSVVGGGGLVTLLVDYEATATDVSKSLSFAAVDFNDDSEILIILDGITAGAVNFNFQITGEATSNYFADGAKIVAGTETLLDQNGFTGIDIVETSILDAADRPFFIVIHLGLNKGGVPNHPMFTSIARGHLGQEIISGSLRVNKTSIDSVLFGGNWKSGTRVTIYKVARA